MAWTTPRTWNAGETVTSDIMNTGIRDNLNVLSTFSRGGVLVNPNGITASINVIVWYATYNSTVTNIRGYRVGGTTADVNARKNGSSTHLASNLTLSSANTWMDGGTVQNESYAIGDKMEIMIVSPSGSPTQIAVQVDLLQAA